MNIDLISEVRALIGVPPVGLEFLEYIYIGFLLIFLVWSAANIVSCVFRWIGGGM